MNRLASLHGLRNPRAVYFKWAVCLRGDEVSKELTSEGYTDCLPICVAWAAADPGRRFDDLFNFVHDPATLMVAF